MKVIYASNKQDFEKKRKENISKYYKHNYDGNRADFYAKNGSRMLSVILKK